MDALFSEPTAEQRHAQDNATPAKTEIISLPEAQPEPLPARQAPAALEEIIVTAQRREESIQDTPISIAALSKEQLEIAGINGLGDIGANVPSLQIEPFPTSNATLRFYIRGMGIIDAQVTQDPAVGVYADGVYIARSTGMAFDVADLERIEVLRGPQGTLYGRNTTGGAINLVTRKPNVDATTFEQSLKFGDRQRLQSRSVMNVPLSDALAVKLALVASQVDGYVDNTGPGGDYGDRNNLSGRFDLRWLAAENWILDYNYDRSEIDFYNYQYQGVLTPEGDKGQLEAIKREAQANSVFSNQRLNSLATGMPLEESSTLINGHALSVQREFDDFDVKYIGAYRDLHEAFYTDLGGGAGSTNYRLDTHRYDGPAATALQGSETPLVIPYIEQDQWSHELQILGSAMDGRLDYIAGAFWFTESAAEVWQPTAHQFSAAINPIADQEGVGDALRVLAPRLVAFTHILNEVDNQSAALFGQTTWTPQRWDQRLHVTLGYRHSEDTRRAVKTKQGPVYAEFNQQGQGSAVEVASPIDLPDGPLADLLGANVTLLNNEKFDHVPGKIKFSDDSITLIAEWDLNQDTNVYGKYVEAYKSGGFNTRDPQLNSDSGPASDGIDYGYGFADGFDKEKVRSLEGGLKGTWLEQRLRINSSVFYTAYNDMQVNFILSGTVSDTKTTNAGEARMWGVEIDLNYAISRSLRFDASYAYLNAKITEVINADEEEVSELFQFNSAPKHSATLNLNWQAAELGRISTFVNLGYQFTGQREGGTNAGRPVDLPAYGLLNLYLGAKPVQWNRWHLSGGIWMRNLLDSDHEISAIDNLPHADRAVLWNEPRSFGLDFKITF